MSWLDTEIERKYHKAANLFPLLTGADFDELKTDIAQNGLFEAIWIHPDGSILDGRNRHRACIETETEPRFRTWNEQGSLVAFVVAMNLHRRHLTYDQRVGIALLLIPAFAEEAKERQGQRTDIAPNSEQCFSRAAEQAAQQTNVGKTAVYEMKAIQKEQPELAKDLVAGKTTVRKERKKHKRRQKKQTQQQERKKAIETLPAQVDERFELFRGDFAEIAVTFESESFDVIITDPPYAKEYTGLYEILAEQAQRLLKPGGSLLAMAGQSYLPVILSLMTKHMAYQWTLAYLTPGGQSPQIWTRNVNTFWKPVLWFVKGKYDGDWHGDVIKSDVNDNDKRFHHWGQSESGMARIVENFSRPGDLILDPFCGGGTTGVVSLALNRRFVGIDIEQDCIRKTRERLLEVKQ